MPMGVRYFLFALSTFITKFGNIQYKHVMVLSSFEVRKNGGKNHPLHGSKINYM